MRLGLGSSLFAPIHCAAVVLEGPGGGGSATSGRVAGRASEQELMLLGSQYYVDSVATNAYSAPFFFFEVLRGTLFFL